MSARVSVLKWVSDAEPILDFWGPYAKLCPGGGGVYEWNTFVRVSLRLESRSRNLVSSAARYAFDSLFYSYDQWDPCGEGEQLQVPRCKHLRGPDMDYTHPNTG